MAERNRFHEGAFDGLPIVGVPHIRKLVKTYSEDSNFTTESFFSFALLGYYDAMHGGLGVTAGHILYRLSDSIEEKQREKMMIYPSSEGSIIIENGQDRWASLEDWRKLWEEHHLFIPEYQKRLYLGSDL